MTTAAKVSAPMSGLNRQTVTPALVAGGIAAGWATTLLGVWFTDATKATPLWDPGVAVRWSLPLVRTANDLAQSLTIGLLMLAVIALPVTRPRKVFEPALRAAAVAAGAWAVFALLLAVLVFADASGLPMSHEAFGPQFASFLWNFDLGRGLGLVGLIAAVIATFAAGATTLGPTGLLFLLSLVSLIPPALAGHSSGATDHETAVTSLGLHLLGVVSWAGGLAALVLLLPWLSHRALATAARRFSTIATWSFFAVVISGTINGLLRLGGISGLTTRYGVLLLVKVAAFLALGAFGWWHRQHTLPALASGRPGAFARLATIEAGVLVAVIGLGEALSRSQPPVPDVPPARPSPALQVTGYELPPPPNFRNWLTVWQPDLLWVTLIGLGVGLYIVGLRRLAARGDRWPVNRTILWMTGLAALTYITCGPPAAYGRVQFSAHMIGHMSLAMGVPALLVLGAPITLALRALKPRRDGTRGAREWLLAVTECGYMRFLTNPIVVSVNFGFALFLFYYSGLFQVALTTHVGHEIMHIHFLFAGYLLAWVMIGVDPGTNRPSHPLRLVLLFVTMGFHAFFGVSVMSNKALMAPEYFGRVGRDWGGSLLADQQLGGGMTWAIGEIPTLTLALILALQWTKQDAREAKRSDRAADRDGNAELNAYNAMLANLAAADARQAAKEAGQDRG